MYYFNILCFISQFQCGILFKFWFKFWVQNLCFELVMFHFLNVYFQVSRLNFVMGFEHFQFQLEGFSHHNCFSHHNKLHMSCNISVLLVYKYCVHSSWTLVPVYHTIPEDTYLGCQYTRCYASITSSHGTPCSISTLVWRSACLRAEAWEWIAVEKCNFSYQMFIIWCVRNNTPVKCHVFSYYFFTHFWIPYFYLYSIISFIGHVANCKSNI